MTGSQDPSSGQHANPLQPVLFAVKRVIVGQDVLLERMAVALLCGGHLLVEGVPGLAKTLSVKSLAAAIGGQFQRVQFTPDLVPADLTGTRVYHQHSGEFQTQLGPVFANLLLADEINRAPAKVQSALLEVMQEHQVTIGRETFRVPEPFLVMATQNPIESEGTYPLPEAQVDRFMLKVVVGYPTATEEHSIVDRALRPAEEVREMLRPADLVGMQQRVRDVYVDPAVVDYAVRLVNATRHAPAGLADLKRYVSYGASPRASIALVTGARALAFTRGRSYALPADVRELALDVLRHRIVLSYEALADDITSDAIITQVLDAVAAPEVVLSSRLCRPAPPRNASCSAWNGACSAALRAGSRAATGPCTGAREPTWPGCAPTSRATTRGTSTGLPPPG
jgi:MoxR-like ATPase